MKITKLKVKSEVRRYFLEVLFLRKDKTASYLSPFFTWFPNKTGCWTQIKLEKSKEQNVLRQIFFESLYIIMWMNNYTTRYTHIYNNLKTRFFYPFKNK